MTHTTELGYVVEIEQMSDPHLYNSIAKSTRLFRNSVPKKDDDLFKQEISYYVFEAIMRDMNIVNLIENLRKELNYDQEICE